MTRHLAIVLALASGCTQVPRTERPRPAESAAPKSSPVATALRLGSTLTVAEVDALEQMCRSKATRRGQGCGWAKGHDGVEGGAFWNEYELVIPGAGDAPVWLNFGHMQRPEYPLFSLHGPGFTYRREGDLFVILRPAGDVP